MPFIWTWKGRILPHFLFPFRYQNADLVTVRLRNAIKQTLGLQKRKWNVGSPKWTWVANKGWREKQVLHSIFYFPKVKKLEEKLDRLTATDKWQNLTQLQLQWKLWLHLWLCTNYLWFQGKKTPVLKFSLGQTPQACFVSLINHKCICHHICCTSVLKSRGNGVFFLRD